MRTLLAALCLIIPLAVTQTPANENPEECNRGLWGSDCQLQCGWCYRNGGCFRRDGICYDRMCEDDWTGDMCTERCPPGSYGRQCSKKCPQCIDRCNASGCNERGCVSGRVGRHCLSMCPKNRFGPKCAYWCSAFCHPVNYTLFGKRRRCHPVNGTCLVWPSPWESACRTLGPMSLGVEAARMNPRCLDNGLRDKNVAGAAEIQDRFRHRIDRGRPRFQKPMWKACNAKLGRSCDRLIRTQMSKVNDGNRQNLIRSLHKIKPSLSSQTIR